ncbi:hypothetical protein HPQ64_17870 [Rhizobiales bacterium]|uniref:hypothetical protein n=1 Tax=Hongsoonwoonella zoysiae TaxID=2821844 RepID=UPI0015606DC7|nr:hypothetical protein [Hongsoonwoonella zoysiae]NRG19561.1 hypothetical protein [Hongsoonwoonella zoysiae]
MIGTPKSGVETRMKKSGYRSAACVVIAASLLAGCAGIPGLSSLGNGQDGAFAHEGKTWIVTDDTVQSKIVTSPSGLSFGFFGASDERSTRRQIAQAYLNEQGRENCFALDTKKISSSEYESQYICA